MASKTPFTYNNTSDSNNAFPTFPGAYLIDDGAGSYPIFSSIASYDDRGMVNIDNYYIVMPGFILIIYSGANYNNSSFQLANSTTDILYVPAPWSNGGSSCKLYFGTTESEIIITGIS